MQSTSNLNPLTNQTYSAKYYDILRKRLQLPVWEYKKVFMETLQSNKVTVLVGETGKQAFVKYYILFEKQIKNYLTILI